MDFVSPWHSGRNSQDYPLLHLNWQLWTVPVRGKEGEGHVRTREGSRWELWFWGFRGKIHRKCTQPGFHESHSLLNQPMSAVRMAEIYCCRPRGRRESAGPNDWARTHCCLDTALGVAGRSHCCLDTALGVAGRFPNRLKGQAGPCLHPGTPTLSPTYTFSTCPGLLRHSRPQSRRPHGVRQCEQWALHLQKRQPLGYLGVVGQGEVRYTCMCQWVCVLVLRISGTLHSRNIWHSIITPQASCRGGFKFCRAENLHNWRALFMKNNYKIINTILYENKYLFRMRKETTANDRFKDLTSARNIAKSRNMFWFINSLTPLHVFHIFLAGLWPTFPLTMILYYHFLQREWTENSISISAF